MQKMTFFKLLFVAVFLSGLIFSPAAQETAPNGAFIYSYPLALPPGTNGVAPQLALSIIHSGGMVF